MGCNIFCNMKTVLGYAIWLPLFISRYTCVADEAEETYSSHDPTVKIGAFFHNTVAQTRLVFEHTFYRFNVMEFQNGVNFESRVENISSADVFESGQLMCNMAREGIAGIIGPTSAKAASLVESICLHLEIPHLQIIGRPNFLPHNNSENYTLINLFPRHDLLIKGIGVMASHLHWKSFVVLYQNAESLIRIQDILKLQSFSKDTKYNDIMLKELGSGPDYKPVLKEVADLKERRIVLECEAEKILDVLSQAKELKLLESSYQYFLTSLDAHTVNLSSLNYKANITTIRIINTTDERYTRTIDDWKQMAKNLNVTLTLDPYSIKTESVLLHDALALFMKTVKLLQFKQPIQVERLQCFGDVNQWTDGIRIVAFMKAIKIDFSLSGPIRFDRFGRRTNFTIYLVEGNRDNVQATWNPSNKDAIIFLRSEADRTLARIRHIEKGILIVSSRRQPPYLSVKENPTGEGLNSRYEGFSLDLMDAIAAELAPDLDLKFKFEAPENMGYGKYVEENKTWDGIIGEILTGRAQFGICDLTITHQRRDVVDFSTPFMSLGISILHKKPGVKPLSMFTFLDPFSDDLWIYTATLYLIITVVIYFIARMSPPEWENPHPCDQNPEELENIWDLKNCLWLTLGSIMNQGCDILPKGMSSRMATAMWWFFAIIVTNSYMANLTAFLTVANLESEIQSVEDLAKQTKVKYGVLKGGSTEAFFRDSKFPLYQKMWTTMLEAKPTVFEDSNENGVNRVNNTNNERYAYLMESTTLEYNLFKNCQLKKIGDILDGSAKAYGIAMPLDYPLRSKINEAILQIQEKGIVSNLTNKWWNPPRDKPVCEAESEEADSAKLSYKDLIGMFLVLYVGLGLAYVVGICEFLWNVKNISVDEHITYLQALKIELLFFINIWVTKKRVKPKISESSSESSNSDRSRSRSIARSILQGAGSLFNLNILKSDSPSRDND